MVAAMIKVAALQLVSSNNLDENLATTQRLIAGLHQQDVKMVVLPENFAVFGAAAQRAIGVREAAADAPIRNFMARMARQYGIWLVGGTIPICDHPDDSRPYSSCLIFNDDGEQVARYNKIHLFDVDVADGQGRYAESDTFQAGNEVVLVDTPYGRLGVAVCYDLRFPELFRLMFQRGVDIMALPSAFTRVTGAAHWLPLLRARAIENSCYMIAANQGGRHSLQRETFGHSCVISAWGEVLACVEQGAGSALAEIDLAGLEALRRQIPLSRHQRFFVNDRI
jgi:nitrilase